MKRRTVLKRASIATAVLAGAGTASGVSTQKEICGICPDDECPDGCTFCEYDFSRCDDDWT